MAAMNRYKRSYPGLGLEQRVQAVDGHLRPWLGQLEAWQEVIKPAAGGPWFVIDDAKQSLNRLAESFTGTPLWGPSGNLRGWGSPAHNSQADAVDAADRYIREHGVFGSPAEIGDLAAELERCIRIFPGGPQKAAAIVAELRRRAVLGL